MKRAIISVTDKTGIVDFARALCNLEFEILSTGGTAKALSDAGVKITKISDYTGSPEILDGRVKTLHPKIHGGLLGIRGNAMHEKEMKAGGIEAIDMLVVNLYRFEETVAHPGSKFGDAMENIDIGGPAMLRSAAKNFEHVSVVTDPSDYRGLVEEMKKGGSALSRETNFRLAKKAFALVASYDAAIMNYLCKISDDGKVLEWPERIGFVFGDGEILRYGENPQQKAAFYRETRAEGSACIANAKKLQGRELSYNNIMDADAAVEATNDLCDAPCACVIVKHANPCGIAVSNSSVLDAYNGAFSCDPVSAFGGIVSLSRPVDEKLANALSETFYEVIAAPRFEKAALEIFSKKKNLRLLEVPDLGKSPLLGGVSLRKVGGGILIQDLDRSIENVRHSKLVTKRKPTEEEWKALEFAWRAVKHVKSNAIVFASADRTLGIGAGQTSRVDSVKIATTKMNERAASDELRATSCERRTTNDERRATGVIVIASDAFFPFRDGIDAAALAGATAVVQPGGSLRDEEVIAAADKHNMAMVFTGVRHFRH